MNLLKVKELLKKMGHNKMIQIKLKHRPIKINNKKIIHQNINKMNQIMMANKLY